MYNKAPSLCSSLPILLLSKFFFSFCFDSSWYFFCLSWSHLFFSIPHSCQNSSPESAPFSSFCRNSLCCLPPVPFPPSLLFYLLLLLFSFTFSFSRCLSELPFFGCFGFFFSEYIEDEEKGWIYRKKVMCKMWWVIETIQYKLLDALQIENLQPYICIEILMCRKW